MQNFIRYFRYDLLPALKVRLTYWWWIFKYGGKKNIPPELIFGKIQTSMERMKENLMMALRSMPDEASEDDKKEILELIRTAGELEEDWKKAKTEKR